MKTPRRSLSDKEFADAARLKKIWDEKSRPLQLTQLKAAKEFGYANQSAVSQYLNARIPLNLETAAKFAKLLSVSISDISPRLAEALVTGCPSGSCPIEVAVPEGSIAIEATKQAREILGDCRWYLLDERDRTVTEGVFQMEVRGECHLVRFMPCESGFQMHGASPKPTHVSHDVVALLPIKGRVLYKIAKV